MYPIGDLRELIFGVGPKSTLTDFTASRSASYILCFEGAALAHLEQRLIPSVLQQVRSLDGHRIDLSILQLGLLSDELTATDTTTAI